MRDDAEDKSTAITKEKEKKKERGRESKYKCMPLSSVVNSKRGFLYIPSWMVVHTYIQTEFHPTKMVVSLFSKKKEECNVQ